MTRCDMHVLPYRFMHFQMGFESSLRRSWTGKNAEKNVSRDVSIRISIVDCW